jgi:hypothetical protein
LGLLSTIRKLSVLFITFFHTRKTSDWWRVISPENVKWLPWFDF